MSDPARTSARGIPAGRPGDFRLKGERLIRPLFERDRSDVASTSVGCVRLLFRWVPMSELAGRSRVRAVFAVSARTGGAVVRNRIRRVMRETFRRSAAGLAELLGSTDQALTMAVLFRGAPGEASERIRRDLPAALVAVASRLPGDRTTASLPQSDA